jgi:hypothetical protein
MTTTTMATTTTTNTAKHCDHPHHHAHDDDVKSFVFRSKKAFNPAKLEDFLGAIVQVYGPKMLRYKGVLHMKGSDRKVIFQGVHQLMGSDLGPKWAPGEDKGSKMVFIGIDLPRTCCCRAWNSASSDRRQHLWPVPDDCRPGRGYNPRAFGPARGPAGTRGGFKASRSASCRVMSQTHVPATRGGPREQAPAKAASRQGRPPRPPGRSSPLPAKALAKAAAKTAPKKATAAPAKPVTKTAVKTPAPRAPAAKPGPSGRLPKWQRQPLPSRRLCRPLQPAAAPARPAPAPRQPLHRSLCTGVRPIARQSSRPNCPRWTPNSPMPGRPRPAVN